jgi:hypothetical protein
MDAQGGIRDAAAPHGGQVNAMPAARFLMCNKLKYRANNSFAQMYLTYIHFRRAL